MKALLWILGIAALLAVVGFGFLSGNRQKVETTPDVEVSEVDELFSEVALVEAEEIDEEAFVEIDPWLDGKRTTAPKESELSFENPIVQYMPDRSVIVHKLIRITLADGSVTEAPVKIRARVATRPMNLVDRREQVMEMKRQDPEAWANRRGNQLKPGSQLNTSQGQDQR